MHNIVIPLVTIIIALAGSQLTSQGMKWYGTLKKPSWTPGGGFIGAIWTIIFILAAVSALIFLNLLAEQADISIGLLFVINGALNVFWSYIFFFRHHLGLAIIEMCVLNLSILLLMYLIWPLSTIAALLLLPYFLWVCFATYIAVIVRNLNTK